MSLIECGTCLFKVVSIRHLNGKKMGFRGSWERPEEVTVNVSVQRCKAFWVNSCLPLRLWSKDIVCSSISVALRKRVTGFIFLL